MVDGNSGFSAGGRFTNRVIVGLCLLFALSLSHPAIAISIYDVIELSQNDFSDEQMVSIIRNTGSAFDLEAEDIPRLKKLGVSETVIQAMLALPPVSTIDAPAHREANMDPSVHSAGNRTDGNTSTLVEDPLSLARDTHAAPKPARAPTVVAKHFSTELVAEDTAGSHSHVLVKMAGLPIMILRDEGSYPSVEERGATVIRHLQAAAASGVGTFMRKHEGGFEQVVFRVPGKQALPILNINSRDARAYDVRSENRVTTDLLAAYLSDLLNDYWSVIIFQKSPERLVNLHRGNALTLLFRVMVKSDGQTDTSAAVLEMPRTIKRHLERLAQAVPDDYKEPQEHEGEES